MQKSIKSLPAVIFAMVASLSNTGIASAASCADLSGAPEEVRRAAGCAGNTNDNLPNLIVNILNAIIAVIGIVAVIYIIIGGVQYMTSAGDSSKTQKARQTILYATIGLVICALAFVIVNFVIVNILGQSATP